MGHAWFTAVAPRLTAVAPNHQASLVHPGVLPPGQTRSNTVMAVLLRTSVRSASSAHRLHLSHTLVSQCTMQHSRGFCLANDPTTHPTYRAGVPSVLPVDPLCNAKVGAATWSAEKSLWNFSHAIGLTIGAALTVTDCAAFCEGFAVFSTTTGVSVLFGHSLGMHRLWIHGSYETYKPVQYLLVHLGTIMGIAGPVGMKRAHDLRVPQYIVVHVCIRISLWRLC